MVKVKLFGLLRLDTGLKELELENDQLRQAIYRLKRQLKTISRM